VEGDEGMKKINIYICLILTAMLVLTSCKGDKKKNNDDNQKGPVTLSFSTFYEDGAQAEGYREIVKAFESSHSNIKINLQTGATSYDEKIQTSLKTGKGPDIIGMQRNKMLEYIKLGNIKDISSWVDSQGLKNKYFGVNLGYGKYDGKYYGVGDLPYTVEWFYNVDLFKKAGVSEPTNLNELTSACSKLQRYTTVPVAIGAKDDWAMDTFFGLITGQTISTDDLSRAFAQDSKESFSGLKGSDDAVNLLSQLIKSGVINKKCADYSYADAVDAFVKGKAAILPMGSWAIDKIEKSKPKGFNYKVFEKPVAFASNPNSSLSATATQVITVNAKTKHEKEAMEFMTYLFSDEAQKIFADKNGISGLKSANKEPQNAVGKQVLNHFGMTDENSNMYVDNISAKMADVTGERLVQLITGKLKPAEVWQLIVDESHV
jgi:ABC-type sugar transport system, periplasmic component